MSDDNRIIIKKVIYSPWQKINRQQTAVRYLLECNICKKHFGLRECFFLEGRGNTCGSKSCRYEWLSKISQGRIFTQEHKKKISLSKRGEKHHMWKGGITKDSAGYVYIKSADHPCTGSKGYFPQHRLVMEEHIGRFLTENEVIHHINGIKDDNRLENLQLMTSSEHRSFHLKKSPIIGYRWGHDD